MPTSQELFETLFQNENIKIERITSYAQITPEGEWYDQESDEFVILSEGSAELLFDDGKVVKMSKGDSLHIKAHQKHRVEFTSKDALWLAIFFKN